jgi:hypothetical protein
VPTLTIVLGDAVGISSGGGIDNEEDMMRLYSFKIPILV